MGFSNCNHLKPMTDILKYHPNLLDRTEQVNYHVS